MFAQHTLLVSLVLITRCHSQHVGYKLSKSSEPPIRLGILDSFVQGVHDIATVLSSVPDTISILLNQDEEQINLYAPSDNEDAYLNITQLTAKYGYPCEEHSVETEDGYIINMHRIPHGRKNRMNNSTVFLMHGFMDSSDSWILQGPDKALAYILADEGFDVWLGNARGNKHALRHNTLNRNQSDFWDFTWEDMGIYDLPVMIDHALNVTDKESLYYIGYSQGTTSFFVMTSLKPEYNDKIKMMFALAPVAWMANVRSPLVKMFSPAFNFLSNVLWDYNFINTEFLESFSGTICGILGTNCHSVMYMIVGHDSKYMNDVMPVMLGHMPTTSSTLQLVHYGQLVKSGRFCRFDFGAQRNMEIYGAEYPPDYDLSNVAVPVVLYFSENDWLADIADVQILEHHLQNIYESNYIQDFNHLDFLYASKANEIIYSKIVTQILDFAEVD
ncbi:unnamed protein product [Diatraea saccharalis]|uniref:Partial AB-hydrolase lipase domain-containing protein n=1 Tax=Diatraea saccharalis TaxID=40085 RepID=A0A9N9R2C1_9NEOP|nr:unnamed protein product [Diatraea saccharalis]